MRFIVRREDTGTFLTPVSYGSSGWSDDLQEARVFKGKGAATNAARVALAASPYWTRRRIDPTTLPPFKVVPVELRLP